jgi:hypothetical protein
VLALGCLIAACGSAGSSSSASNTSTTTASAATGGGAGGGGGGANPARRAALVACLKQHGVTLPARPPGAGGGTGTGATGTGTNGTGTTPRRGFFGGGGGFAANPKMRAALQACGARFGFGNGGRFRGTLARANVTKYVTCVRLHGYNLPSPNFSGKGPVFPSNIRSNAKFQAASKACQSLLVPPRPSGSGTGTNTTSGA